MALLNSKPCIPFEQFCESAMPQEFSLPMPIMKYIWKNPASHEVYQKLIQCCKLFFIKNPILVINTLYYRNGWKYCDSSECPPWGYKCKSINFDTLCGKIWLSKRFDVSFHRNEKVASGIIPQIYQCDIRILNLSEQLLTENELKFFSSGVKECYLFSTVVIYDNIGEYVSMEDIITLFPGAEKVFMSFSCHAENAFCKSYDEFIVACNTVEKVEIDFLRDNFNVQEFYQRLKSSKNRTIIQIYSLDDVDHLNKVIDDILTTESFEFVPPVIYGRSENFVTFQKMKELQKNEASKYR